MKKCTHFPMAIGESGTLITSPTAPLRDLVYTWWIHSLADSQMTVLTHRARLVATRWMKPKRANRPNLSTITVELTNKKCICKKVKSA